MNRYVLFFYDTNEKKEFIFGKNSLFEGYFWCLNFFGVNLLDSELNNNKIILKKITLNEKIIFESNEPLKTCNWVYNAFLFLNGKFLDKVGQDEKLIKFIPKDGWTESITLLDDEIMTELVDENYTFKDGEFVVDLNYVKKQIYSNVEKWIYKLIELDYIKTSSNIPLLIKESKYNSLILNDNYYLEVFEITNKIHTYLYRYMHRLNNLKELGTLVMHYINGPFYIASKIKNEEISSEDAKYMELVYRTFISESTNDKMG